MQSLTRILTAYAQDPVNARNHFVWGRNRFLLTFNSYTCEITVLDAITWDVVCEDACPNTLATAIHTHRR